MPYASDRLRARRQELGLKVSALARRLPVSRGHLVGVESGREPASIELLNLIAKELSVPVAELLTTCEREGEDVT